MIPTKRFIAIAAATGFVLAAVPAVADHHKEKKKPPVPGGEAAKRSPDKRPERGPGGPGPGGPEGRPERPPGRPGAPGDMFGEADTDGDGKISKQEWTDAAVKRAERSFGFLDADKSGDITKEEIAKMRERRPGGDRPGGGGDARRPQRPEGGFGGGDERGGPRRPGQEK